MDEAILGRGLQAGEGMFVPPWLLLPELFPAGGSSRALGMLLLLFPAPGGGTSGLSPLILGVAVV